MVIGLRSNRCSRKVHCWKHQAWRVDGIVVENGTRNETSEIVLRPIKRQPAAHYVVPTSLMTFP